jgi:diaminohydroxyphosphoribosylaminopyrimidine deaminase/5-amino-6-(5-phosphoribosylamino)uracil reductase
MGCALDLALRGRFGASPNPMVGAVVVDPAGNLVGEGYHAAWGSPHAEIMALGQAGARARGGTLYVTLEPCSHHGKTPPCVDAIVAAGIQRVVVALRDPNPVASGGVERLRAEGIEVAVTSGSASARLLNRRWLKSVRQRRPWVTLKAAMSIDGRIATRSGQSQWITGESARVRSLELREEHDAILVGIGTVLADNPRLTRRLGLNPGLRWRRIVVDSHLRTPISSRIVESEPDMTLLVHTEAADPERRERLQDAGVETLEVATDEQGRVALPSLLDELGRREIAALLVEGGSQVHGAFVDGDLYDEVVLFVAPMIIGGGGLPAIGGTGVDALTQAPRLELESIERRDDDLELRGVRQEDESVHGVD